MSGQTAYHDPYGLADCSSDRHALTYADRDANGATHGDSDRYANAATECHSYTVADRDPNGVPNGRSDRHAERDRYASATAAYLHGEPHD